MADSLVDWCGSGAQQSHVLRVDNRLRAVGDLQLAIDIERVGFHRTGTDHQLRRDLGIGHASGYQAEDFLFTGCQAVLVRYRSACI